MTQTHYVVGPPGCGKTSWVSRQVERSLTEHGQDRALVVSLTRAAAREAAGRVQLKPEMVGTLHAHCYRALGRPKLLDSAAIKDWNAEYPAWELGRAAAADEEGDAIKDNSDDDSYGARLLERIERARHKMQPVPTEAADMARAWEDFKQQTGRIDFTDMIGRAYHEVPLPPGDPALLIADEAQDLSDLEVALLKRWSVHVEHFALVGDPNQSIYHWRHSSEEFAHITPTIVLGQSYRVPRLVQERAVAVARTSSTYLEAEYKPRDEEGRCVDMDLSRYDADELVTELCNLDGDVMVLATCAYMLKPLIKALRESSVPYHNPYRTAEALWNPLAGGSPRRRTGRDRLEAFLAVSGFLSGELDTAPEPWQLQLLWKTLKKTAAAKDDPVEGLPLQPTMRQMLTACKAAFKEDEVGGLLAQDTSWLMRHTLAAHHGSLEYPIEVYSTRGWDALLKPQIIVGTIHSVKGGEADTVVLCPDLSAKGAESYERAGWAHRDGVIRSAYVGMTRARKQLLIMEPGAGGARIEELVQ